MIRILLINQNGAEFKEINNTTKGINDALGWYDFWNTPVISIGGEQYICICSDNGKRDNEPISCIGINNLVSPSPDNYIKEPFICGTVIITKYDGIDDYETLNDRDVELLKEHLYKHNKPNTKDFFPELLILD